MSIKVLAYQLLMCQSEENIKPNLLFIEAIDKCFVFFKKCDGRALAERLLYCLLRNISLLYMINK